ncbi:MAG TPA: thioredoxin domain-containing protein [Pyrinomonadaceae bacterium]
MSRKHSLFSLLFLAIAIAAPLAVAAQRRPGTATPGARPAQAKTPAPTPTPGRAATTPAPAAAVVAPVVQDECGCEPKLLPEVLAVANGVRITKADISPAAQAQIDKLKGQVIEARAGELDLQINSRLLDAEAKKRGTTSAKLLEQEVIAKTTDPTDAEAQVFYDQNKARINEEFAKVRADIIGYLREQRQREAAKALADRLRAASDVKVLVQKPKPPATDAERARVLATVNGQNITSSDIEDSLKPLVFEAQEKIFQLRKREVDIKINDLLLEQEAQKRQVTARALLETEVKSKLTPVTEADAQKFYNENKTRINGDFAQTKSDIIQFLQQQAEGNLTSAFAQRLRNAASVQTFITQPEAPVYQIATDDQPSKGAATAPVTVVEFTDYQCPSCAQTHPVIERLAAEYGDRLRVVARDFPLSMHENAFKAAEAAEAAREQGKYWEYVALLYRNQSALGAQNLREFALAAGLDVTRFDAALSSGKLAEKVQRDLIDGQRLGVGSTPTIFVNGRRVNDRSYEGLKLRIEEALKTAPKK